MRGDYVLLCEGAVDLLFTENETNKRRLWNQPNDSPFVKDGINDFIVHGNAAAVNPGRTGTKAAARYTLAVGGRESQTITLRLVMQSQASTVPEANEIFATRIAETDAFYASITPPEVDVPVAVQPPFTVAAAEAGNRPSNATAPTSAASRRRAGRWRGFRAANRP